MHMMPLLGFDHCSHATLNSASRPVRLIFRWGAASGVACDGGLTVSSVQLTCGATKLGGRLSSFLAMYTSLKTL